MAVYTKINNKQIKFIEKKYNIGKIINYSGIKKGIENTNFLLKTKKNKYILTIYEKRVQKKDLPFFVNLMSGLSRLKVKCPVPIKDAEALKSSDFKKPLAYITQTTLSVDDTAEIIDCLKKKFPKIRGPIKEDICYATTNRQSAVKVIADKCDMFFVIGSRNRKRKYNF